MAMDSNKKLSILYTLEVLKEYSDENHLLTQDEIADKIYKIYGMNCERKSISTNINSLIDFGLDITKTAKQGCFLSDRIIEPSEITYIVDALFSSKSITGSQAKNLSVKLSKLLSKYQQTKFNYLYKAENISRTNNKQLFYTIDTINLAIENNKQISFTYNQYDMNENLCPTKDKKYIVNPYFMINNQGKYYLICNYDYFDTISNYKIDQMTNIEMLDKPIKSIKQIKGFENGLNVADYINEHIYVFSSKSITAKLQLDSNFNFTYIYEWFGKNAKICKDKETCFAEITANEDAIIYWCLQYGDCVKLLSPVETKNKLLEKIKIMYDKYKG